MALWQGTGNNYGYGSYDKYVQDYYVGSKTVEQVLAACLLYTSKMCIRDRWYKELRKQISNGSASRRDIDSQALLCPLWNWRITLAWR